jgi:GT2 family glycosyltransferase
MNTAVDLLVVNYNTAHLLPEMFESMNEASGCVVINYLIVDNASRDDSVSILKNKYSNALLVENQVNVGFGRANNQLVSFIKGNYALLLNTDAFPEKGALDKTIDYMESNPDVGVLGVRLIGPDAVLQPCCRYFPTPFNVFLARTGLAKYFPWVRLVDDMDWDHCSLRECDWVPGCYYLIRREVIEQVGLFDPIFFLYCEEVDHCKRVKEAGWKVIYFPHASVVHIGGESAKSAGVLSSEGRQLSVLQIESEMLYFRKHHGLHGLIWHMLLVSLGDLILLLKDVLKRRGLSAMRSNLRHTVLSWRLLFQTRLAARPTR